MTGSGLGPITRGRTLDLRLVVVALATWASAFVAPRTTAPVALLTAVTALIAAGLLWRWIGRRGAWAGATVAALLGVVCGGSATAARLAGRDAAAIAEPARAHATVTARLSPRRDPRPVLRDAGAPPTWLISAQLEQIQAEPDPPVRVRAQVLVLADDAEWQSVRPGQRLFATGRLSPSRGSDLTAAVLFPTGPPVLVGEPPWVHHVAARLRAGLRQTAARASPAEPGGLLPGVAFGDVSGLDPGLRDDLMVTGMTHLVAVSGTHCAIVIGFVFLLARAARAPPWLTAFVSSLAMAGYVILCQASPSVIRASVMGTVALVALAAGRPRAALPALGATITVLVVVDPQLAGNAAFTMSVLATGGLLLLAPRWRDALRRRGVPTGLAEALAVPAAAQVAVAPVIAGMNGTVSLVAVVANLVATPVLAPATILGVLAAVLSVGWPAGAELLAWLAGWPAWWLVLVARHGARMPAAVQPWPAGWGGGLLLAGLTLALLLVANWRPVRRVLVIGALAVGAGVLPVSLFASGWPPTGTVVVVCAVGQGDLVVVPVTAGSAVVVDAGPTPAAADRCLRDLGVWSVPLFVVSHFHADHVGGVAGVFRERQVTAVVTSAWLEPLPGYRLVAQAAARTDTPMRIGRAGEHYQVGPVGLTVLGPRQELVATRSDPNNNSLVLLAQVRGVRALLAGDAEAELQQQLLATPGPDQLRAEVLKVPHHGSAYQDDAFLPAVTPAVALVSVGADNSSGHPEPAILAGLARSGAQVLRTDLDGDLAVVFRPDQTLAVAARPPPPSADR